MRELQSSKLESAQRTHPYSGSSSSAGQEDAAIPTGNAWRRAIVKGLRKPNSLPFEANLTPSDITKALGDCERLHSLHRSVFPRRNGISVVPPSTLELESSEKLDGLEAKLAPIQQLGLRRYTHDPKEHAKYVDSVNAIMREYRDLVLDIILARVEAAIGVTTEFKSTPEAVVGHLRIRPGEDYTECKTVYLTPVQIPALLFVLPRNLFHLVRGNDGVPWMSHLHYAIASQMTQERDFREARGQYQGVYFSGLNAYVGLLHVPHRDKLFEDHASNWSLSCFSLPSGRERFVECMVDLICNHRDPAMVFRTSRLTRWREDLKEFIGVPVPAAESIFAT